MTTSEHTPATGCDRSSDAHLDRPRREFRAPCLGRRIGVEDVLQARILGTAAAPTDVFSIGADDVTGSMEAINVAAAYGVNGYDRPSQVLLRVVETGT